MMLKELGVHATVFAFGLGDENLHAPNEFFRLANFRTGMVAYAKLLERLGYANASYRDHGVGLGYGGIQMAFRAINPLARMASDAGPEHHLHQ